MELLYNPDSMLEEEIKKTFVARHGLIDELVALIKGQPDGAGVQHVAIIAPRGMGKTTVLLMARFAIRDDEELGLRWQAVRFPEESYGVYDLSDFWVEALVRLAAETDDEELLKLTDELKRQYPDSEDLQEAALAHLKDWSHIHHKRLVLLVDNFDMILSQIDDERDNASLRDVLMNDGTMMLIGAATTFFREARAYDQPLYNFFKIYDLHDLKFEQMQELLRRRAEIDGIENFEEKLKANAGRLRVLEYFTGGSPRLVLMLYRVVTQSNISEVRRALEKLLDEVTPYYKAKIESLPAQQRKILDHIARVSGQTREGVRPAEIAEATRLKPNQVSAQLNRLSELGYVRAANLRERNSYYTLSEPLYAIWHQMRFGRNARQRMQWLVDFLKVWYDAAEMGTEDRRLADNFRAHLIAGRLYDARNALDHRRYLAEAMDESPIRSAAFESVILSYLELKDIDTLKKEVLTPELLNNVSNETLNLLQEAGCVSEEIGNRSIDITSNSEKAEKAAEVKAAIEMAGKAFSENRFEESVQHVDRALELNPDLHLAWALRALAFSAVNKFDEAVTNFDRALKRVPDSYEAWRLRGLALGNLGKYEEALTSFDRALEIKPEAPDSLLYRGRALKDLGRYEEALSVYDRLLAINPDDAEAWRGRGNTLQIMKKYEEALASYDRALELKSDDYRVWNERGFTLYFLDRHEEAIESYDQALRIEPHGDELWINRGLALAGLNRYDEAIASYDRATGEGSTYAPFAHLFKFAFRVMQGDIEIAKGDWTAAMKSSEQAKQEIWLSFLSESLLDLAEKGHFELIRQLIRGSNLEEKLFPLARALDYLLTGDRALIEKLSPEVRGVVEEIVNSLSKSRGRDEQPRPESRSRKLKTKSSRGSRKRLR